jgi:hypothetical protein
MTIKGVLFSEDRGWVLARSFGERLLLAGAFSADPFEIGLLHMLTPETVNYRCMTSPRRE